MQFDSGNTGSEADEEDDDDQSDDVGLGLETRELDRTGDVNGDAVEMDRLDRLDQHH